MKFAQFCDEIEDITGYTIPLCPTNSAKVYHPEYDSIIAFTKSGNRKAQPALYHAWETGGYSGGSCWGEAAHQYSVAIPDTEWKMLDEILEKLTPNISFLKYKRLRNTLIESGTFSRDGYYGNNTDYTYQAITIEDLYNFLKEEKLI